MAFSDNLRRIRVSKGMTQEALALACGWSGQSRIANYESAAKDAREPKLAEVPLLATALGVSVAELFGELPGASQSSRLDPDIVRDVYLLLRESYKDEGKDYSIEAEPDLFAETYERYARIKDDGARDGVLVSIGQAIGRRLQGAGTDEEQGRDERASGPNPKKGKKRASR